MENWIRRCKLPAAGWLLLRRWRYSIFEIGREGGCVVFFLYIV